MSRAWLPRRFPLIAAALVLALASPAVAQRTQDGRVGGASAVIGAPATQACATFAARGEATDAAIAACTEALTREVNGLSARLATTFNRGALHLMRNDTAAALADFDAILADDPHNAEALLDRGAVLLRMRQPAQAVAPLTEALSLGVHTPHLGYYYRGAAREMLGDDRGALEDYTTALQVQADWGPQASLAEFTRTRIQILTERVNNPNP